MKWFLLDLVLIVLSLNNWGYQLAQPVWSVLSHPLLWGLFFMGVAMLWLVSQMVIEQLIKD